VANNASDFATNSICLDAVEERKVPALGDGTLLPGSLVTMATASGKVDGADAGSVDELIGILEKAYDKSIDTAPADGQAVDVIIPKQGHRYIVRVDSGNTGAGHAGKPLELSATSNGEVMDAADLGDKSLCRLARDHLTGDDFTEVFWGAS
jgi:hypothetical protein